MGFWSRTTAAPTLLDRVFGTPAPRVLRTTPAPPPPHLGAHPRSTTRRATPADAARLCAFLRRHYGGADWWMDISVEDVAAYLRDDAVILGLLLDGEDILASIASVPFSQGATVMSHGATLAPSAMRVIEGLCVRTDVRGAGVAGHMIAWADAETSRTAPVVHLWARELPHMPPMSTAIALNVYAYLDCATARVDACRPLPPPERIALSEVIAPSRPPVPSYIVSLAPNNRCGRLMAWRCGSATVVVADTRRKTRRDGRPIYEVVWCMEAATAATATPIEWRTVLEAVGAHLSPTALLFASSARAQGGADSTWGAPWHYGTSGVHALYLYNYMPPSFGGCEVYCMREEL